jgi:hypothetical protein
MTGKIQDRSINNLLSGIIMYYVCVLVIVMSHAINHALKLLYNLYKKIIEKSKVHLSTFV